MQHQHQESNYSRVDYVQVGLTSKNAFKMIGRSGPHVEVVIGDHSGSLHLFTLRADSNQIETVFKTLPGIFFKNLVFFPVIDPIIILLLL